MKMTLGICLVIVIVCLYMPEIGLHENSPLNNARANQVLGGNYCKKFIPTNCTDDTNAVKYGCADNICSVEKYFIDELVFVLIERNIGCNKDKKTVHVTLPNTYQGYRDFLSDEIRPGTKGNFVSHVEERKIPCQGQEECTSGCTADLPPGEESQPRLDENGVPMVDENNEVISDLIYIYTFRCDKGLSIIGSESDHHNTTIKGQECNPNNEG